MTLTIYTDGACSGNPGPGGWAAILIENSNELQLVGAEESTTNNRMEMMAVIKALESLEDTCTIDLYSDSQYVILGITKWIKGWQAKNWRTADNKEVKNIDLWQRILLLSQKHKITWNWVKGHDSNTLNNLVDKLARDECAKICSRSK